MRKQDLDIYNLEFILAFLMIAWKYNERKVFSM